MTARPPFHLAFTVRDVPEAKDFYVNLIGCTAGAESPDWIVLDFFGHKVSAYRHPRADRLAAGQPIHDDDISSRHFGAILDEPAFNALAERLTAAGVEFITRPQRLDAGRRGEQLIMFLRDPSGNALEFNCLAHAETLFHPE
ncbi:MAG: VOC family protein [Alphaproteobacteria bacterium]